MKKDDRKMLTIIAAVAAVGGYYYYRNRKKALATAESEANVLRYNAAELKGIQVDLKAGDLLEIASPGTPENPDWALNTQYPVENIESVNLGNGQWVWRMRGVVVPDAGPWIVNLHHQVDEGPGVLNEFTLKVNPA